MRDGVDAVRRIFCKDDIRRFARKKVSNGFAAVFVALGCLPGKSVCAPSVIACVGEKVLVYRFYCGLWCLTRSCVIKVNDAFKNWEVLAYHVNVEHQAYLYDELHSFCGRGICTSYSFRSVQSSLEEQQPHLGTPHVRKVSRLPTQICQLMHNRALDFLVIIIAGIESAKASIFTRRRSGVPISAENRFFTIGYARDVYRAFFYTKIMEKKKH